jgi:UDP-N-acetylmuramate dehydrogenase
MPITIEQHVDLLPYNTFKVEAKARYLVRVSSPADLQQLLSTDIFKENSRFILGGGSNVVFRHDFDGLIIKSEEKNVEIIDESDDEVTIKVASGVVWHDLVTECLNNNWGGIENLSLIPGTVGAAPIQNIGAYGVEIQEVVKQVHGVMLESGEERSFNNDDCQFSYRESIFKHVLKENFFISSVTLRLTKKNHRINTEYDALKTRFNQQHITTPTIQDVSRAVIEIRKDKLPDPFIIGNAGSFFKNPVISSGQLENLKKQWPLIPSYHSENQTFKVPAGWLIENCGWKGKRMGRVGVHQHQALVIVNHDHANGEEIFQLSEQICRDVENKFGLTLTREVNVIG